MLVVDPVLSATRHLSTRQNGLEFRGQLGKESSHTYWRCDTEGGYNVQK